MTTATPSTRTYQDMTEQFITATPGNHGVCNKHRDVPLMKGTFTWGVTANQFYGGGLETFPAYRHADGTPCVNAYGEIDEWVTPYHVPTCKICKTAGDDTFNTTMEAYGDRITCRACGDTRWYSIGD